MQLRTLLLSATAVLALGASGAAAQQAGDITLGVGIGNVNPKDDNGTAGGARLDIDDDTQITLTLEYFITDNLGVELLAATPFTHDIKLGGADIGSVKHLPPTISLNYHFQNASNVTPFIGAGVNYTTALDVDSSVPNLKLEDSWGLALHAGLDYRVSEKGQIRADIRWMDIDMKVKSGGTTLGTAEVDPLVVGLAYVHTF
ncbi:OmpW/AlkL family protein [Pseudooceanicola marinus]|uniref:OmpW/AlkL family protein n=1 Tax=Pseudooceanicola marinus TaxID=396013 RepID=UPI001C974BAB|nr:OmpW family outer membrane protein [Pseudooceanicola marinus]MBY5972210.1 outer membrane beta-barrel protein [Ferrimonas balearica]MCA1335314.1 outer membrane beta-barrel protein [Pseudooceanicola marinus]